MNEDIDNEIKYKCKCGQIIKPISKKTHLKSKYHDSYLKGLLNESSYNRTRCDCGRYIKKSNLENHKTSEIHIVLIKKKYDLIKSKIYIPKIENNMIILCFD